MIDIRFRLCSICNIECFLFQALKGLPMLNMTTILDFFEARKISRVLFVGPMGTGKTTICAERADISFGLHAGCDTDTLIGGQGLRDGSTFCDPQLAALAMRDGLTLHIDEIDSAGPAVETVLLGILDDVSLSRVFLPDGQVIKADPKFGVLATTNESIDAMPARLVDRFDVIYRCSDVSEGLREAIGPELVKLWSPGEESGLVSRPISPRRLIGIRRLIIGGMDQQDAIKLCIGADQTTFDAISAALVTGC